MTGCGSYIDGQSSIEERSAIEKLIEANKQWKEKYHELLELHQLVQSSALEAPSYAVYKKCDGGDREISYRTGYKNLY